MQKTKRIQIVKNGFGVRKFKVTRVEKVIIINFFGIAIIININN